MLHFPTVHSKTIKNLLFTHAVHIVFAAAVDIDSNTHPIPTNTSWKIAISRHNTLLLQAILKLQLYLLAPSLYSTKLNVNTRTVIILYILILQHLHQILLNIVIFSFFVLDYVHKAHTRMHC